MKKYLKGLVCAALATVSLGLCVQAQNFQKINEYAEGHFKDVPVKAWYAAEVKSAYELGFMNGKSDDSFVPDGAVTVAEGITMASRVHAIYNGKTVAQTDGGKWYDMYVDYAKENGIVDDNTFDSFTRNITRAEMAYLFASALPKEHFAAVNTVEFVPDVNDSAYYSDEILMLYRAGVVMGSDEYGTFNPDSDIKRSESAAIINRVAIPDNRIKGTLKKYDKRDAYKLAYSVGTYTNSIAARADTIRENIDSGWVYDNRGGAPMISIEHSLSTLSDISDTQGVALIRDFNKIDKDVIQADFALRAYDDGVYCDFRDDKGNTAYQVKLIGGKWNILEKGGKYTELCARTPADSKQDETFRVYLNLKTGKSITYVNGKECGTHDLLSDNVMSFRFATDEKSKTRFTPGKVSFNANYSVFEEFDTFGIEPVYGWQSQGNAVVENGELVLRDKASVAKKFDALDSKYAAETYIYRSSDDENIALTVMSGDNVAIKAEVKNGKLYASGKELYDVKGDMWYRMRIEANPSVAKAKIYLNGRVVGEVPLTSSEKVDSYVISSENGTSHFDYIEVFEIADHHDYAPIPEAKASLDDYKVFINVCSLWHNDGVHIGWSCITPFDDNRPVLGYYDEGVPELADWEINYMVNHGIDVQVFCWYNNKSKGAIKDPTYSDALHEGLMYSKYSDYMKYVILWETGGTTVNSAQFRDYVVPYWFENYFLDDRYLKIDNRIVLHAFGANRLAGSTYFGSPEKAKEELMYLNEVAKSYGFDGMLYTCADTGTAFTIGFEARGAYHWDKAGNTYLGNVQMNEHHAKATDYYQIPTVSVGFDSIPWYGGERAPLMSVEAYEKTSKWVRDTYLPTYGEKGTWKEKAVWLSTWNEYGEGTYIMPSGLNGFGYLDVLRDTYTELSHDHKDYIPTPEQAERINHLYPQHARRLWRENKLTETTDNKKTQYEVVGTYTFKQGEGRHTNADFTFNADGSVKGVTTKADVQLYPAGITDGVNIDEVDAVKVTMQVPAGSNIEMFYSTTEVPLTAETRLAQQAKTDDKTEYIFEFKKNKPTWKGTLTLLRLDPCHIDAGIEFYVEKVEFLKEKDADDTNYTLTVNGVDSTSAVPAKVENGKVLFPFDPETTVHYSLYVLHNWNKDKGILTLTGNGHETAYTVGSDKAVVDGKEVSLGYTVDALDGLPRLDFVQLASFMGYTSKVDGTQTVIETPEKPMFDEALKRFDTPEWSFNGYDTQGFYSSNGLLEVNGEYLHFESLTSSLDLIANNTDRYDIDADVYNKFEMRVRYKYERPDGGRESFAMYYLTDADITWDEKKTVRIPLKSSDSKGEWEVYTVDLSGQASWKDNVTTIRIDPFNALGYMDIDYIKLIPDEEKLNEEKLIIKNGDAEKTGDVAFYSINGKVTIVEDSKNKENHVYNIQGNPGKNWTYFMQNVPFKEGEHYTVSFDARALPDVDGNVVDMVLGCNIQYKDADDKVNHGIGVVKLSSDGSWAHFEGEVIIGKVTSAEGRCFSVYADPTGDNTSGCFQIDNVILTKKED